MSVYRKLIRHTSTYAVATVARRFASFFMLPVYTRYFTTSDYGVLELLDLAGTIIFYLIGARLSDGLLYFYAQAETEEEKLRVTHSALLTSHVCGLTGAIVGYLAAPWASIFMFGTDHYTYYMQLVPIGTSIKLVGRGLASCPPPPVGTRVAIELTLLHSSACLRRK